MAEAGSLIEALEKLFKRRGLCRPVAHGPAAVLCGQSSARGVNVMRRGVSSSTRVRNRRRRTLRQIGGGVDVEAGQVEVGDGLKVEGWKGMVRPLEPQSARRPSGHGDARPLASSSDSVSRRMSSLERRRFLSAISTSMGTSGSFLQGWAWHWW